MAVRRSRNQKSRQITGIGTQLRGVKEAPFGALFVRPWKFTLDV